MNEFRTFYKSLLFIFFKLIWYLLLLYLCHDFTIFLRSRTSSLIFSLILSKPLSLYLSHSDSLDLYISFSYSHDLSFSLSLSLSLSLCLSLTPTHSICMSLSLTTTHSICMSLSLTLYLHPPNPLKDSGMHGARSAANPQLSGHRQPLKKKK